MTPSSLAELPSRACSTAGALEVVGDRWSLPVGREVALGSHRCTDVARSTGAPRDGLSAHLDDLVAAGVPGRRPHSTAPPRSASRLAPRRRDLLPVLHAPLQWGDRWVADAAPVELHHDGHRAELAWTCRTCGRSAEESPVQRVGTDTGRALGERSGD